MVPRRGIELPNPLDVPEVIAAGKNDPICPTAESEELAEPHTGAGANTKIHWEMNGHMLTRMEVDTATKWYEEKFGK